MDPGILEGIKNAIYDTRISLNQAQNMFNDALVELAEALESLEGISTNVDVLISDSKEKK